MLKVKCRSCGASKAVTPPPWVVASGKPFTMTCAACGNVQEVVPTGLVVLDEDLFPDESDVSSAMPALREGDAPTANEISLAMPAPSAGPPLVRRGDVGGVAVAETSVATFESVEDEPTEPSLSVPAGDAESWLDAEEEIAPPPELGAGAYAVRIESEIYEAEDIVALGRWIAQQRVHAEDLVATAAGVWAPARSYPELAGRLANVSRGHAPLPIQAGPPTPEDSAPPPPVDEAPEVVEAATHEEDEDGGDDGYYLSPTRPGLEVPTAGESAEETTGAARASTPGIKTARRLDVASSWAAAPAELDTGRVPAPPAPSLWPAAVGLIALTVAIAWPVLTEVRSYQPADAALSSVAEDGPRALGAPTERALDGAAGSEAAPVPVSSAVASPVEAVSAPPTPPAEPKPAPVEPKPAPVEPKPAPVESVAKKAPAPKPAPPPAPAPAKVAPARVAPERVAPPPDPAPSPTSSPYASLVESGWRTLERGDVNGAVARFEDAIRVDRHGAEAHYGLGYSLLKSGHLTTGRLHLCRARVGVTAEERREIDGVLGSYDLVCE